MLALDLFNDVIRISSRLHIFGQIENSNKSTSKKAFYGCFAGDFYCLVIIITAFLNSY